MSAVTFQAPKKGKLTGILAIVLYFVTGVMFLTKPEWMAEFTRWALFAVLLVYAVMSYLKYMKKTPEEGAQGYLLTGALLAATLAVLTLFNASLLTDDSWGVLLLAGGFMKFQTAIDMGRLGHQRWWLFLYPAAISLIFGILVLTDIIRESTPTFIGIALIIEALVDIAALVMTNSSEKLNKKNDKQSQAQEAPDQKADEEAPEKEQAAEPAEAEEPAQAEAPAQTEEASAE